VRSGIFRFNGFFAALFGAITRYLNIPAFCSLFIMGRGRKGLIDQSRVNRLTLIKATKRTESTFFTTREDPLSLFKGIPLTALLITSFYPLASLTGSNRWTRKRLPSFFSNEQRTAFHSFLSCLAAATRSCWFLLAFLSSYSILAVAFCLILLSLPLVVI